MASRQEQKLLTGVEPLLEPGERAVAAITAQAKGTSRARGTVSGVGGAVGAALSTAGATPAKEDSAAADAGLEITSPMALIVTDRRVLTVRTGTSIGLGMGGGVKSVMSGVPLDAVDAIETKRAGLGKRVELTVRGVTITLECNAGADTEAFARSLLELKAQ